MKKKTINKVFKVARAISSVVVPFGVGTAVNAVLYQYTPVEGKKITKIGFAIGKTALASYAGKKVGDYVDDSLVELEKDLTETVEEVVAIVKEAE